MPHSKRNTSLREPMTSTSDPGCQTPRRAGSACGVFDLSDLKAPADVSALDAAFEKEYLSPRADDIDFRSRLSNASSSRISLRGFRSFLVEDLGRTDIASSRKVCASWPSLDE